jgi:hypothetical protein
MQHQGNGANNKSVAEELHTSSCEKLTCMILLTIPILQENWVYLISETQV